jgi:1-deoxy-D-xylulose-5-phosphate synthase (EC 2.2.1.7)
MPVGKGRKLTDGTDVAILSIGASGNDVSKAIELVSAEGFLLPLRYDLSKTD